MIVVEITGEKWEEKEKERKREGRAPIISVGNIWAPGYWNFLMLFKMPQVVTA